MSKTLIWPYLPENIKGVNNEFFNKFVKIYEIAEQNILNIDSPISLNKVKLDESNILNSPEDNLDFIRLEPPYNIPCTNSTNNCLKKAAFQSVINNKYYCWFHINYNK